MSFKTLTDEELALLKRGLIGLSCEILEWIPKRQTWRFRKPEGHHVEAGQDVLSKIETLLAKLDTIDPNSEAVIVQDFEGYD